MTTTAGIMVVTTWEEVGILLAIKEGVAVAIREAGAEIAVALETERNTVAAAMEEEHAKT